MNNDIKLPTIDPKQAMVDELQAKAALLLKNALTPVVDEVGRNYGREGLIAFLAALQVHQALEVRNAFGTGIAMAIMKSVVHNVLQAEEEAAHAAMVKAAGDSLRSQGKKVQ